MNENGYCVKSCDNPLAKYNMDDKICEIECLEGQLYNRDLGRCLFDIQNLHPQLISINGCGHEKLVEYNKDGYYKSLPTVFTCGQTILTSENQTT